MQTLCSSNHDFAKISRFQLYTPWVINPDDPLAELVSNNEGEIRFDKLGTGGPASKFGKVREAWKNHLKLSTDAELYDILRPLRIRRGEDLQRLRQLVSERLENVGLKPIDFSKTTDEYPGLIFRLSKEGRDTFTREQLLEELKRDGLVVSPQPSKSTVKQFAIRSFFRAYDFLEDDSDRILALETAHFEGRFILDPALWNKDIRDEIVNFANANFIQKNSPMDLHLDVHSSLAIAIGSLVSLKSMVDVAPVQKFNFKDHVWRVSDQPAPTENLRAESVTCSSGPDVAVLINITRSTTEDVKKYIVAELPDVGELLVLEPQDGSGQHAIRDADHAWKIAEQVSAKLSAIRSRVGNKPSIHIFNSAPNGLLFFIGRMASPAGTLKIYEFDFEKKRHGSYELSVILPWK